MAPTRIRALGALATALLVATGCGVRRSEQDVAAAARGGLALTAATPSQAPPAGTSTPGASEVGAIAGGAASGTAAEGEAEHVAAAAPVPAATGSAAPSKSNAAAAAAATAGGAAPRSVSSNAPTSSRSGSASAGAAAGSPVPGDPGGTPPGATASPALSPVKIGNVSTLGGVVGSTLGDAVTALTAWTKYTNDRGGLNGHPVELFIGDDGGDPARHRALHQQLHEEKGVIAFLSPAAPLSGQTAVDYVTQKRLPVIGDTGGGTWGYTSPMYFPQMSTGDTLPAAWVGTAKTAAGTSGKKKLGYTGCAEAQVCRDGDRLAPDLAPKFGLELVYKAQTSVAQPDFTSECVGARNAGVEIFIVISDTNSVIRTVRSCKQIGFNPIFVTQHGTGPTILQDPNTDGVWLGAPLRPFTATGFAGLDEYKTQMPKYAPKAFTLTGELGWSSGKLLELAARAMPEPPTSQAILDGLWRIRNETLGGFTYPLTFERDQKAAKISCWFPAQIENKRAIDRSGGGIDCLK